MSINLWLPSGQKEKQFNTLDENDKESTNAATAINAGAFNKRPYAYYCLFLAVLVTFGFSFAIVNKAKDGVWYLDGYARTGINEEQNTVNWHAGFALTLLCVLFGQVLSVVAYDTGHIMRRVHRVSGRILVPVIVLSTITTALVAQTTAFDADGLTMTTTSFVAFGVFVNFAAAMYYAAWKHDYHTHADAVMHTLAWAASAGAFRAGLNVMSMVSDCDVTVNPTVSVFYTGLVYVLPLIIMLAKMNRIYIFWNKIACGIWFISFIVQIISMAVYGGHPCHYVE